MEQPFDITLQKVLEHARCILWDARVTGEEGNYQWVNGFYATDLLREEFGLQAQPGETVSQMWLRVISREPGQLAKMDSVCHAAMRSGAAGYQQEFCLYAADGTRRWMKEDVKITLLEAGLRRLTGVALDITAHHISEEARIHAEEALEKEQRLLNELMRSMPDEIFFKDAEGRFLKVNHAVVRAVGAAHVEDVIGKTDFDFFPPDDASIYRSEELSVMNSGEVLSDLIRSNGAILNERFKSTIKAPMYDAHGKLCGIAGINRDVTEARRIEDALRLQVQRLQTLHALDEVITLGGELRQTFDVLLEKVAETPNVVAAAVLVPNPHNGHFDYKAVRGFKNNVRSSGNFRCGPHVPQSAQDGHILHLENSTGYTPWVDGHIGALLAVPLTARGKVRGVLEIFCRSYSETQTEWFDFLRTLAARAAVAIDNFGLLDDIQRSNAELTLAYDITLEGWSQALDLRDKETEGHTQRVTEMTVKLARANGFNSSSLIQARRGALLHDIGKMGIPDGILLKPGPLNDEEWTIMRKHPSYAYELLWPIAFLRPALNIPLCHHEKWDGSGYPRGLKGEEIPIEARMFAVVDVFDALSSDRPYRKAWPVEKVQNHIITLSGTHFDPAAAELFQKVFFKPQ